MFPAAAGRLLGRAEEICELSGLLEDERLVTLTGAPGIGKTRLALELAEGLGARYEGGSGVVELAAVVRGGQVPGAVASGLSVDEVAGQGLTDTVVGRLRDRRLLLVLDNCEHVLDACAQLVEALLGGCPQLRIMVTSREPLAVPSERVWQLAPLSVPASDEAASPEALAGYAAVGLFVEHARAVQPEFVFNAYVAPAVAEICRRLDGIPLAIELAAARVESLTPEEIARHLDDRFGLLKRGGDGVLRRHQTLEAALDWSYDLLSGPERALLRRLSVFAGGCELEAAEAVCAGGEVRSGQIADLLARLVAKSLVLAEGGCLSTARCRLFETIRAYGADRLQDADEVAGRRAAHAHFYLHLAERAEPELTGPAQQQWLGRLEAERPNLRSAFEWSLGQGEAEPALRLARSLVLFWRVRCHFSEGRELLEAAVSASNGAPAELRAKALWGMGFLAHMMGEIEGAIPPLAESLSCFRELGDASGCARALLILGNCNQYRAGQSALPLLEESAAMAREVGDEWCLVHALGVAGLDYACRDELPDARPLFEECLIVARRAGDTQGLRLGQLGLGLVALRQGDFQLAESLLEEAVELTCELGEDYSKATALQYLGQLASQRGDYGRARELLDEALALFREVGPSVALLDPLAVVAEVTHAEGDCGGARLLFGDALVLARAVGVTHLPSVLGMGRLAADDGKPDVATRLFEDALEAASADGDKGSTAEALHGLGQLARADGEVKRAAALHSEALELRREIGSLPGVVSSLEAFAGLTAASHHYDEAARLLGAADSYRTARGYARTPRESSCYEADLSLARQRLSAKELEIALAQGATLTLEEAAVEASKRRRPRDRPSYGWSSLTESERNVVALVADGLTNPEIAERLFISPGTVKNHLSHVFAKLGVRRRRELEREVRRRREQSR